MDPLSFAAEVDGAAVTAVLGVEGEGEVGTMIIPGNKYAVARFEIVSDEFGSAWDLLCSDWLPQSGYQPADGPSMELYRNDPKEHPEHKHIVDICVPVKPL